MNKFYGAHDQWTDLDKQNDVLITSTDGVIDSVKVNGEDYGGGGSSDFSTAEVVINITGADNTCHIGNAVEVFDEDMLWCNSFETGTYMLVLYKGTFEGRISASEGYKISNATGTGGVTISQSPVGKGRISASEGYKVSNATGTGGVTISPSPVGKSITITGDGTLTVEIASKA